MYTLWDNVGFTVRVHPLYSLLVSACPPGATASTPQHLLSLAPPSDPQAGGKASTHEKRGVCVFVCVFVCVVVEEVAPSS